MRDVRRFDGKVGGIKNATPGAENEMGSSNSRMASKRSEKNRDTEAIVRVSLRCVETEKSLDNATSPSSSQTSSEKDGILEIRNR